MKLISVTKSDRDKKKWKAIFEGGDGKRTTTHFGYKGMDDYTLTGDKEARERYRSRARSQLQGRGPTSAAYLSFYLLWGDSKSLQENIKNYKKRFNL